MVSVSKDNRFKLQVDADGHRLDEVAIMNPPEDKLPFGIEIKVFGETEASSKRQPHFHVYATMNNRDVNIEIKIRQINELNIWRSATGHNSWDSLVELKQILSNWLELIAFDTIITNKEAIRQEWNHCNMSCRVRANEL